MPVKVFNFHLADGLPKALERHACREDRNCDSIELLNILMAWAGDLCVICGNLVSRKTGADRIPLMCPECLKKFGLEDVKRADSNGNTDSQPCEDK